MIRRLRTRNFLALPDLQSPEFSPHVNVVVGPNGAGKGSLKNAISLLFSGTAEGVESGRDLESLRTIGGTGKRWQIDALLDGDRKISRTDDEGPKSSKQTLVESLTNVTGAKARACIESGELLRLDMKARQRLLADLAPKATVVLPPAIKKAVFELLDEDLTEVEVSAIERLYKAAYEARTEAARDVKAIGELEAPAVPEVLGEVGADPEVELVEVRNDLSTLRHERDVALGRARPIVHDLKPYQDAVAKTTRELESTQQQIGLLPTKLEISRLAQELLGKIERVTEVNAEIDARRRDLKEKLGAAEGAMKAAKTALEAVTSQRGEVGCCPVCDSKLTKVNRGKLELALKNKVDAAGREWQRINEELKVAGQPKSAADLEIESDKLSAKETKLVNLLADETRLAARLLEEKAALEETESKPAEAGDPEAAGEAMALADRITKGEEILEALVSYIAARKSYETNVGRKADALKRHAALDQLVTDLGPSGIRKGCANAGMFAFHEDLNKLLAPRGFTVDLRPAMDAEGDPIVTIGGRATPLARLSDGEKIAFGAAFACAVATVTGFGIVVVDRFEELDPGAHDAVMGILCASPHQSFVFSVERDEGMEAIAADVNAEGGAMRMFLLRDGQLVAPGIAAAKETAA
jgi:DNA repair exonuclease SbcCD ATPase subunit